MTNIKICPNCTRSAGRNVILVKGKYHQICQACRFDITSRCVSKSLKTKAKTPTFHGKRSPSRKSHPILYYGRKAVSNMSFLIVGLMCIPFFTPATVEYVRASTIEPVPIVEEIKPKLEIKLESKQDVKDYVLGKAKEAGVHVAKIDFMVEHESKYNPKAKGDMDIICKNPKSPYFGKPVEARGLFQITKCYWWTITDEQAYNPVWATEWALAIISRSKEDCMALWSSCASWYQ